MTVKVHSPCSEATAVPTHSPPTNISTLAPGADLPTMVISSPTTAWVGTAIQVGLAGVDVGSGVAVTVAVGVAVGVSVAVGAGVDISATDT